MAAALVCFGFAPSAPGQTTNKSTHAKSARVNINTADTKTLETLPGVTASLANKIIAGRPYSSVDDLKKVKGLTETKINGMKNHITFGSTTASTKKTHKTKSETASNEETNAPSTATASTKKSHKAKTETAANQENEETTTPSTTTGKNSTGKSLAPTGSSSGTSATPKKTGPSEPININTASLEQLEELPGIGPTRAQAILDYRQQNGNFGSIEDIEKVKGIKEGEFSKIKDMIKVE